MAFSKACSPMHTTYSSHDRVTHEDFARMARGDSDSTRPKTRQRLQLAMEKSKAISEGQSAGGSNASRMANSYGGEEASLIAVRNRMLQQRLAIGPRYRSIAPHTVSSDLHAPSNSARCSLLTSASEILRARSIRCRLQYSTSTILNIVYPSARPFRSVPCSRIAFAVRKGRSTMLR